MAAAACFVGFFVCGVFLPFAVFAAEVAGVVSLSTPLAFAGFAGVGLAAGADVVVVVVVAAAAFPLAGGTFFAAAAVAAAGAFAGCVFVAVFPAIVLVIKGKCAVMFGPWWSKICVS